MEQNQKAGQQSNNQHKDVLSEWIFPSLMSLSLCSLKQNCCLSSCPAVTGTSGDGERSLTRARRTNGCRIDSFLQAIFGINACPPHYRSRLPSPRTWIIQTHKQTQAHGVWPFAVCLSSFPPTSSRFLFHPRHLLAQVIKISTPGRPLSFFFLLISLTQHIFSPFCVSMMV